MTSDEAAETIEVQVARTQALEADFIGLELDEAKAVARSQHGLQLRVIDRDDLALTSDLRSNRITIDIRSGRVTKATAG